MPATIEEISEHLESEGIPVVPMPEKSLAIIRFPTRNYRTPEGEAMVQVVIILEEDGRFIKVMAPHLYLCNEVSAKEPLFETLLHICWITKMIQFEYQPEEKVVRAIIEFPIEDAVLTKQQIMRCIRGLITGVEKYHDRIQSAIDLAGKATGQSPPR